MANSLEVKLAAAAQALESGGVMFVPVRSRLTDSGGEWIDEAWDRARDKIAKRLRLADPDDYLKNSFLILTSLNLQRAVEGGPLILQFGLQAEHRDFVKRVMKRSFGARFRWSGKDEDVMVVAP